MPIVVHINGWPGAGKLSVARLLADRMGAHLIDNHSLLGPAQCIHPHGSPAFYRLYGAVRDMVFADAVQLPGDQSLVLTDALAHTAEDIERFEKLRELAAARNAEFIAIELDISETENARRITDPARALNRKLRNPDTLAELKSRYQLLQPDLDVRRIVLDVTDLSAETAANRLFDQIA